MNIVTMVTIDLCNVHFKLTETVSIIISICGSTKLLYTKKKKEAGAKDTRFLVFVPP